MECGRLERGMGLGGMNCSVRRERGLGRGEELLHVCRFGG